MYIPNVYKAICTSHWERPLYFFFHIYRKRLVSKLALTEGRAEEQIDEEEEVRLKRSLSWSIQKPGRFSNPIP